jgi:DNA-binding XRE family transcriptional regulator
MRTFDDLKKELYAEDPEFKTMVSEAYKRLEISDALRKARKSAGMTQKQVAEKLHVSRVYVSQLEGNPANVSVMTLLKYASAVGADLRLQVAH